MRVLALVCDGNTLQACSTTWSRDAHLIHAFLPRHATPRRPHLTTPSKTRRRQRHHLLPRRLRHPLLLLLPNLPRLSLRPCPLLQIPPRPQLLLPAPRLTLRRLALRRSNHVHHPSHRQRWQTPQLLLLRPEQHVPPRALPREWRREGRL